jgi:sec-independent protein translocase protein TatA
MLLRGLEGWHLVILVAVLVVLFGARKMPDAARSLGQSLRIFKSELKAVHEDGAPPPPSEGGAGPDPAALMLPTHKISGTDTFVAEATMTVPTVAVPAVAVPAVAVPTVAETTMAETTMAETTMTEAAVTKATVTEARAAEPRNVAEPEAAPDHAVAPRAGNAAL